MQGSRLLVVGKQLHFYREIHESRITYILLIVKHFLRGGRRFSPQQATGYPRQNRRMTEVLNIGNLDSGTERG
jgi:hypothetical protein